MIDAQRESQWRTARFYPGELIDGGIMNRAFSPFRLVVGQTPGPLAQAGMGRAFGPDEWRTGRSLRHSSPRRDTFEVDGEAFFEDCKRRGQRRIGRGVGLWAASLSSCLM